MIVRRMLIGVGAAAVLVVGCSSDDSNGAGTTTTAPPPTTVQEVVEEETAASMLAARALAAQGTWVGEWRNTSAGSSGSATFTFEVDEDESTIDVVADLGGNVFGAADPDEETFSLPLFPGTHRGTSSTLGPYAVTYDQDGNIGLVAAEVPALPGATFSLTGVLINTDLNATYEVDLGAGSDPMTGTVDLLKQ